MTRPRQWPVGADAQRIEARECAGEAGILLQKASALLSSLTARFIKDYPEVAELRIVKASALQSEARALQERIQRLMVEARQGEDTR